MPKVSVLMVVSDENKNNIGVTVESILKQSFEDFEFLIIADSEKVDDIKKLGSLSDDDKRFFCVFEDVEKSVAKKRNRLLNMANGEYVAIADVGVKYSVDRLKKEVEYLDKNLKCGCVSGWYEYARGRRSAIKQFAETNTEICRKMPDNCEIWHGGAMFRKKILDDFWGRYEEDFEPAEDYGLFMRLFEKTEFYNLSEVLGRYLSDDRVLVEKNEKHDKVESEIKNILQKRVLRRKKMLQDIKILEGRIDALGQVPLWQKDNIMRRLFKVGIG